MAKRPEIHSRTLWRGIQAALVCSIMLVVGAALYAVAVLVPSLTYRLDQQTVGSKQANSKLEANGLSTVGPEPEAIKAGKASAAPTNVAPTTPALTYVGVTGPAGAGGPPGGRGDTGKTGPSGPSGPSGATGKTGPKGAKGDKGNIGAVGSMGALGAPGSAGLIGPSGAVGPSGAQGIQGPAGQDGQAGKDGADGKDGTDGKDAPVFVSDNRTNNGDGTCFDTWTLSDGSTIQTNNYDCSPAPSSTAPSLVP